MGGGEIFRVCAVVFGLVFLDGFGFGFFDWTDSDVSGGFWLVSWVELGIVSRV